MIKVMVSLPESLVQRMKMFISAGERSQVIAGLLEQEISHREEELYHHALTLENNKGLQSEMKTWDQNLSQDGLDNV